MPNTVSLPDFRLESGHLLASPVVAYDSWGRLNERGDNAVVVCHSLTSTSDAAAWWAPLIGPGRVIDTRRFFVVCLNALGSPYGSTSPLSERPGADAAYGPDFPAVTIRDTVRIHRRALERLGVRSLALAIGGSMGAMQVLEWGLEDDFARALIAIAVGGRHSPWGIAWTEAQRRAIFSDPKWRGGAYPSDNPPSDGLAAARMMAMVSYRSAGEFEERFGRETSDRSEGGFSVESYLRHQGMKLARRFDANCYVQLTRQMNSHDVSRGRAPYPDALRTIGQPTLVVGISSDVLYPLEEQRELAREMPNARLAVLDAPFGHDSFLVAAEQLAELIRPFVETYVDRPNPAGRPRTTRAPENPDAALSSQIRNPKIHHENVL